MSTPAPRMVPVLDVGGTHVTGALVDSSTFTVVERTRRRHPLDADAPAESILDVIAECARTVARFAETLHRASDTADDANLVPDGHPAPVRDVDTAAVWGVSMPDPFDYPRGIALFEGVGKFEALNGVNVGSALLTRVPSAAGFAFLNDADAFVLGEWASGAARGSRRCVGLTLGTGIGSGWLDEGRIVGTQGARPSGAVPPGGRAHRIRLDGAGLEETVSRRGIRRAYRQRTGDDADVSEICERARAGEAAAHRVLDVTMSGLGRALAPYLIAFAPQVVVIGGSMAASWDLFEPAVLRGYDAVTADGPAHTPPPRPASALSSTPPRPAFAVSSTPPRPAFAVSSTPPRPAFAVSSTADDSALIGAARFVTADS